MRHLLWILRFRLRVGMRFLGANAFVLAVLGPLIVGTLFLIVDRGVLLLRAPVEAQLLGGTGPLPGAAFTTLAVLLTALGLGYAFDELYPRHDPRVLLDILPVTVTTRFVVGWLASLAANGLAFAALLLAVGLLGAEGPQIPRFGVWIHLLAAFLPLVGVQWVAVLLAVRLRFFRAGPVLTVAAVLGLAVVLSPTLPALAGVVLAPWLAAAARLELAVAAMLGATVPTGVSAWGGWPSVLGATAISSAVAYHLTNRWQRRDRTRAHALRTPRSRAFGQALARWIGRLGRPVAAQVVRDILLVLRRFSPVVYVSATITVVANALVVAVLPTVGATPFWHGRLAIVGAVAGVLAQVALVPFVLRHELPRFWLERAAGLSAPQIWRAKLWLARLLAVPPLVLGIAALATVPQTPRAYGIATLELLLAAWVVASLIGVATFEIADRPLLGLVFGALVALAWATLMILYRQYLPLWLIGYVIVASSIADRATHRVRFTEVIR